MKQGQQALATGGDKLPKKSRDVTEAAEMQRAQTEVQAAVLLAINKPRDEESARAKMFEVVEKRSFAEKAYYSYPRSRWDPEKKKRVKVEIYGGSIGLAEEIAKRWRNIWYGYTIVHDEENKRTIRGHSWDIENNVIHTEEAEFSKIVQRKDDRTQTVKEIPVNERELLELTARNAAKLMRNSIFKLIPRDLRDELVMKARATVSGGIDKKQIKKSVDNAIEVFGEYGISKEQLSAYCVDMYKHNLNNLTVDNLADLRGLWNALKEGTVTKADVFGQSSPPSSTQPPAEVTPEDFTKEQEPENEDFDAVEKEMYNKLLVIVTKNKDKLGMPYNNAVNTANGMRTFAGRANFLASLLIDVGIDVDQELSKS